MSPYLICEQGSCSSRTGAPFHLCDPIEYLKFGVDPTLTECDVRLEAVVERVGGTKECLLRGEALKR